MLWLVTISETWQAIIYVSMASISMSLVHTSYTVIWANYYGRKHLGSIRGFSSSATVGFSALGALPFGIIYDRTQSYDQALYYLILNCHKMVWANQFLLCEYMIPLKYNYYHFEL